MGWLGSFLSIARIVPRCRALRPAEVYSLGRSAPMPAHVAIIMDGNGRWARQKGLPRSTGHRAGAENVRRIVRHAGNLGLKYLTLFVFSTENWSRPADEVSNLMSLLREMFVANIDEMIDANVQIRVIGRPDGLSEDIIELLRSAEERSRANTGLTVVFAINYGGRSEIVDCARRLCTEVAEGRLAPGSLTEAEFRKRLYAPDIPDPDLLIRTSGELRLSNFMLWQTAYTEIVALDTLWPDFGPDEFDRAIGAYRVRERRFGGLIDEGKGG